MKIHTLKEKCAISNTTHVRMCVMLCRLASLGLPFLGSIPEDRLLRSVRLDEVQQALDASMLLGNKTQLDQVGDI